MFLAREVLLLNPLGFFFSSSLYKHILSFVIPGTNRVLLCKSSSDGQNQVLQIGRPHSTDNEDELQRLAALGE